MSKIWIMAMVVVLCFALLLWWLNGQIAARSQSAFEQGKAECLAIVAEKEILKQQLERKEEKNAGNKKAEIWAAPSLNDDNLQRLFDDGIL